jgi:hypothetical protein
MPHEKPTNDQITTVLDRIADLLEMKSANRFRIQAYRDAAQTVRNSDESVVERAWKGRDEALEQLPHIGEGIASVITSYVHTRRSDFLDQLEGEVAPGKLLTQVPGIGDELAQHIAEQLDISTLEDLEQAAHDGRLQEVEGFGPGRVRNVCLSLAGMLSTAAQRRRRQGGEGEAPPEEPSVEILLGVDADYRRKAEAGKPRKIAPKRFNPEGEAWLPILNTDRKGWHFTALYSNTARAHELNKTDDWVVLYYERDGEEGQATVVTETRGPLEGKRVVRGREAQCRDFHEESGSR